MEGGYSGETRGFETHGVPATMEASRELPNAVLNDEDADDDSDADDFDGGETEPLSQLEGSHPPRVAQLQQIQRLHQPITLVNGQRLNEGFRKPEKTKWTAEEGTFPDDDHCKHTPPTYFVAVSFHQFLR
jgi:hypothetical protein